MGDFKSPNDIESPNSRLKYWIASKATVDKQRKRIKYLHNRTTDLKHKIKSLEELVDHLKDDQKLISDNCFTVLKVKIFLFWDNDIENIN